MLYRKLINSIILIGVRACLINSFPYDETLIHANISMNHL